MKIAVVSPCHRPNPGGMRSHIRQVAAYLRHMGPMVTVVTSASAPVDEPGILVVGAAFTVPFAYDFAHMVFRHQAELYFGKGPLRPPPSAQDQPLSQGHLRSVQGCHTIGAQETGQFSVQ